MEARLEIRQPWHVDTDTNAEQEVVSIQALFSSSSWNNSAKTPGQGEKFSVEWQRRGGCSPPVNPMILKTSSGSMGLVAISQFPTRASPLPAQCLALNFGGFVE
jgi:hypothetical protein